MPENIDPNNSTNEELQSGQAAASEVGQNAEAHRNAIGEMLQRVSEKGIDLEQIAEQAGVPSTDVNALSHDDLMSLVQYVGQNHPEILQSVGQKFPALQGLMGLLGGSGLGGMLSRFFPEKRAEES